MEYSVYTIRDEKGEVVYVGRTSHSALERFKAHKTARTKLGAWTGSKWML